MPRTKRHGGMSIVASLVSPNFAPPPSRAASLSHQLANAAYRFITQTYILMAQLLQVEHGLWDETSFHQHVQSLLDQVRIPQRAAAQATSALDIRRCVSYIFLFRLPLLTWFGKMISSTA